MRSNTTAYSSQDPQIFHTGHMHFFDMLSSFHGLEDQPDYKTQQQTIENKLRKQYLNENSQEEKLCYRTCFKLQEKDYVQFCLQKNCEGTPYQKAANILGYVKNIQSTTKVTSHHH